MKNMSNFKILREYCALCENGLCQDLLTEEEKKEVKDHGVVYLTGKFSAADEINGNKRVYPYNILKREVDNYQKLIREVRSLGELDHPQDEVVSLKNASHIVKELWWDGKTLYGKMKLLNTPSGKIAKTLLTEDKVQLGVSSRALGTLKEGNGDTLVVEENLILIAWDLVSDPSSVGAFLKPQLVNENTVKRLLTKSDVIDRKLTDLCYKL